MGRGLLRLFFNHGDAWGLTLIIGSVCLLLHGYFSAQALSLLAALVVCYWLAFAVNDYFDAPYDALDTEKGARNFFVMHRIARWQLWAGLLLTLAGLLSIFVQFGGRGLLVFLPGTAAMMAYSAPPLRLKSRAGFDLLMHMLFVQTFPYAVCLYLLPIDPAAFDWALLSFFLLGSLGAQLEQQARDYELDRATDPNFTSLVGLQKTTLLLRVVTALLMLNVLVHLLNGVLPIFLAPLALMAFPVMAHRFVRRADVPRSEWLVRGTVAACLAYAGLLIVLSL